MWDTTDLTCDAERWDGSRFVRCRGLSTLFFKIRYPRRGRFFFCRCPSHPLTSLVPGNDLSMTLKEAIAMSVMES